MNCKIFSLILQNSPRISPNEFQYVHHMLVFLCDSLEATDIGASAPCSGVEGANLSRCLSGELIAVWSVGGNVMPGMADYVTLPFNHGFEAYIQIMHDICTS